MQSELNDLQNRYDDLLLIENKSDAEWQEIVAIERRIEQIMFPIPRRADFDDAEWAAFCVEHETSRKAYDDAKYMS